MSYPLVNPRNAFPSMDITRVLSDAEKTKLVANAGLVLDTDTRLGLTGGATYSSGTHTAATAYSFTGDFTLVARASTAGRSGTIWPLVFSDGAYNVSFTDAAFTNKSIIAVRYTSSTGVLAAITESGVGATLTTRTANATCTLASLGASVSGTVYSFSPYNRVLTPGEVVSCAKGEPPAELALPAVANALAGTDNGTFTSGKGVWSDVFSGGISASGGVGHFTAGTSAPHQYLGAYLLYTAFAYPVPGRWIKISATITNNSGTAKIGVGVGSTFVEVASLTGNGTMTGMVYSSTSASSALWLCAGASGTTYDIDNITVELTGDNGSVAFDGCTPSGRWCSRFGNDLIPSATGVVPLAARPYTRRIAATVAGATITAGAAPATIGTLTGATPFDTLAITSVRQWDAVSACWAQARPTNATGVIASATANSTVLLETTAIGSNASVSGGTAVKITHTIN